MKNIILFFIVIISVCVSCSKDTACNYADWTTPAPSSETLSVENYLNGAGIIGTTKHSLGFYYKITQAGTGAAVVNLCSRIAVKYAGRLTNGTVFDPSTPGATTSSATFELGGVIPGWQIGIPLISAGGKITLYIPPSLGYRNVAVGSIPANSILIFDVELVSVSN